MLQSHSSTTEKTVKDLFVALNEATAERLFLMDMTALKAKAEQVLISPKQEAAYAALLGAKNSPEDKAAELRKVLGEALAFAPPVKVELVDKVTRPGLVEVTVAGVKGIESDTEVLERLKDYIGGREGNKIKPPISEPLTETVEEAMAMPKFTVFQRQVGEVPQLTVRDYQQSNVVVLFVRRSRARYLGWQYRR